MNNNKLSIENGVYIQNIQADKIYKYNKLYNGYKINNETGDKDKDRFIFNKNYVGFLSYSLELIELKKLGLDIQFKNGKIISNSVVNVCFDNSYKVYNPEKEKMETQLGVNKLREALYQNGFYVEIDGERILYKRMKRSTAKSRIGQCLFIREDLYNSITKWARLDLDLDNTEVNVAEVLAYESLSLTEIHSIINIRPEEILIVQDFEHQYICNNANVVSLDKKANLIVENIRNYKSKSTIWDGQALLDSSLFTNNKGMMLLRERWFKSCGFNTNIQQFYRDNNIKLVNDLFRGEMDASKIKMITTPSSLKFLKLSYFFKGEKECFSYWLNHIDCNFGVCKNEYTTKTTGDNNVKYNKLTYQLINSIGLTEDEIKELFKEEKYYVENLKDDITYLKEYIKMDADSLSSKDLMYNLLSINSNIQHTKLFKKFKDNVIQAYINQLKLGKIKIEADYYVVVSNPLELLKASCGLWDYKTFELNAYETYISDFKDNQELATFRNPFICRGNVCVCINKYTANLEKYFNFKDKNIAVVNASYGLMERHNGLDMDSDTILVTANNILVNRCKKDMDYAVPYSDIKASKKINIMNYKNISEVDIKLSKNLIGEIVNLSCVFNTNYNHLETLNYKENEVKLADLYNKITILSIASGLEIDKAKKLYNINMSEQLKLFKEPIKSKALFLKYCAKQNNKAKMGKEVEYKDMETGMDYLIKEIKEIKRSKKIETIELKNLMIKRKVKTANRKQLKNLETIFIDLNSKINNIHALDIKKFEKNRLINNELNEIITYIEKLKIKQETLYSLLIKEESLLVFNIMYKAKTEQFLKLFELGPFKNTWLKRDSISGSIAIWGKRYNKVML